MKFVQILKILKGIVFSLRTSKLIIWSECNFTHSLLWEELW